MNTGWGEGMLLLLLLTVCPYTVIYFPQLLMLFLLLSLLCASRHLRAR